MLRLWKAFQHSVSAVRHLVNHERAIQQEAVLLVVSIPIATWIADSVGQFLLLIGAVLFMILIEVLNTAIEAACDAVSKDFHKEIKVAKDCGSLAVLISIVLAAAVWLHALANLFVNG